jgi:hypothetical protein
MHDWLSRNVFGVAIGVLAGAALIALRFLVNRSERGALRLLWRPSGTPASIAARAALGLGVAAGVAGFVYVIQSAPPRWASPLLWTGFGVTMVAAFAVGLTAREDSPSGDREHSSNHDRVT